jgi:hypothetical protein
MRDEERLIRSLEGDLSEQEASELRDRLVDDPDLAVRRDAWVRAREEITAVSPKFEPGFRDRVITRVREIRVEQKPVGIPDRPSAESLYLHMQFAFPRLAAACLIGVVALGVLSLVGDGGLANSAIEALLGLPGATLETAFALGSV